MNWKFLVYFQPVEMTFYLENRMCLAIPGQVESVVEKKATVNFGGVKRQVDLSFLLDTQVADWVLVHVGFAIQKVDEESARETYRLLADSRQEELEAELRQSL